ncbi:uncharacterized protein LOC130667771 [Microplitis mediator]|uniref:uncharacterized protein LOC130667771 n=1 Tax=Microplitis mediator TaxID=375433 RepID=UPI002553DE9E|nr:uncharacterized protein LOC130667771 [Microplitis mediator]
MCQVNNKIFLVVNIIVRITALPLNTDRGQLIKLSVGDVVNIKKSNLITTEIFDNIFNGYDGSKYIEKKNYIDDYDDSLYTISRQSCVPFEALTPYPPELFFNEENRSYKSDEINNINILRGRTFGIPIYYMKIKENKYGMVKLCKIIERQKLNIDLLDKKDFKSIKKNTNYNILENKTAVFRLKRGNETHYVSSLTTGNCLFQIHINTPDYCADNNARNSININGFFEHSFYKTHIISASNDVELEQWINNYYFSQNNVYSLDTFMRLNLGERINITNEMENDIIIDIELSSLPELPQFDGNAIKKQLQHSIEMKKMMDINPGDILNADDLFSCRSNNIPVDNIFRESVDYETEPFVSITYNTCHEYSENYGIELSTNNYQSYSRTLFSNYDKRNIFNDIVRRKHYGVNRKYLNVNYSCLKITICSRFERHRLDNFSTKMIKLDERSKTIKKYNIFENNDIVLWITKNNETHLVAYTERGECIFQTLVYSISELSKAPEDAALLNFMNPPVHKGTIITASDNNDFKIWINDLLDDDPRGLLSVNENEDVKNLILDQLENQISENTTLINLYLDEIY